MGRACIRFVRIPQGPQLGIHLDGLRMRARRCGEDAHGTSNYTDCMGTGYLQHRIRGALNAAGFESTGRKFSAGDYKGMTKFALVHREAR